jgi:hypothetical protein
MPTDDWYTEIKFGNNYELEVVSRNNYNIVYRIKSKSYYVVNENIIEYDFDDRWIIAKSKKDNYLWGLIKPDSNYVYSKRTQSDGFNLNYWIIDKSVLINLNDSNTFVKVLQKDYYYLIVKSGLTGPLDSLEFYNILKERNINLALKPITSRPAQTTALHSVPLRRVKGKAPALQKGKSSDKAIKSKK